MLAKLLIIDDQPQEISGLLAWLQREEYDLSLVKQGDGALALAEQTTPTLIIINVNTPGVGGFDLLHQLRANPATRKTPVILIVPDSNDYVPSVCLLAGANDVLVQPVQTKVVQKRIRSVFEGVASGIADSVRMLEDVCQSATAIFGCDLAWLLATEGSLLRHRACFSERGAAAAEVFVRLLSNNAPDVISFPLVSAHNALSEAALNERPLVNILSTQLRNMPNSEGLLRAAEQLRLTHLHFLPLMSQNQLIGLLLLAGVNEYPVTGGRAVRILQALNRQCVTVLENARLQANMQVRERQIDTEQIFRRMVLDTMTEGLIVLDERAIIRYVNNRLLRLTSYDRHELYGNSIAMLFHPEARRQIIESIQTPTVGGLNQQIVTKVGQAVPALVSRATMPENNQNYRTVLVISDITEQIKRAQALERQSERLRLLNEAMRRITSALTQEDVIETVLQAAFDIVRCENSCLYLFDTQEPDTIRVVAARGIHADTLETVILHVGQGIAGRVIQTHKAELVPDLTPEDYEPPVIEPEGSSVIAVPMMVLDTMVGVLEVINKGGGRFVDEDAEVLSNLAAAASVAMENAHLFGQAQRQVTELSMMLDASSAVSSTLDISGILQLITRRLAEAMRVSRCSISTWHKETNELVVLAEACSAHWQPGEGPIRPIADTPVISAVLQREQLLICRANDPRIDPHVRDYLKRLGMANVMFVPLTIGGTVVGLLELFNPGEAQTFKLAQCHAVREAISTWATQMTRAESPVPWHNPDLLTSLAGKAQVVGKGTWCTISSWDRRARQLTVVRELGFAVWDEQDGHAYRLDNYPTLGNSLRQGMPITLLPALLFNDLEEQKEMARLGSKTGLITPLVVHGEATGLVKLQDVASDRVFDAAEVSLCQAIANVVANALENARLFHSLEKRANALQAAYDELRHSDKLKDDLIQNLSHELKTPLMQSMFELSLLTDGDMGALNDEQKNSVNAVLHRIESLGSRVTDMVSLHAAQELQFSAVEVGEIVDRVLEGAQTKASRAGVKITAEVPDEPMLVRADGARLAEVFDQLLDNAIKFSPNTEQVVLSIENGNGYMLKVCIRDFGIGIDKAEFDRIFQRGYQVDSSATRRFGGTGLGLAIARQVVEAHGGKIWVESSPGSGSRFYFTLPKWTSETERNTLN
ncbi:MAG: GAF domain-containing protein [Anaerolineae bacterium]